MVFFMAKVLHLVCLLLSLLHLSFAVDFTYYVEEGKEPGTYIGDIAADTHVLDSISPQDHKLIRFNQIQHGMTSVAQLFRLTRDTGKLYTSQTLDAEAICVRNEECFKMVDIAVRKRASFIKILEIKVVVKDVNDHQPEFPEKQVSIQFEENDAKGTKVSIPNAIDKDIGKMNSQITYQLKKDEDEPFSLSVSKSVDGTSKLSIMLEEKLDREVKDSYLVQVIAKDGGSPPKQSILDVYISVTDVNDNTPFFSQKVYNVSINNEHDKVLPITILSATDPDLNKNGKVTYHFSSQTSDLVKMLFELNEVTGEIFQRQKFMQGQKLIYKLYIEATDGGTPPLSSTALVLVNLINQQNNPPIIDVNFVTSSTGNMVKISEDIEVGSFIAYMKVTDDDAGQNGEVSCYLHHDKFQLQNFGTKKYKLIVKKPLDREVDDHYNIIISCQDKGAPPLHSDSKFSIEVMDVNDVQPEFSGRTFKFWIDENQKSKFPVGFINATDPDLGSGGKLTYSLVTDNKHFLPFHITDDGLILTLVSLDHEFQDVYKFKVLVKDNGIPPLNNTVNVVVEVRDENDNAPYFTFPSINPFSMDVTYYPRHSKNITVLRAADRDSQENAFLRYEILRGNEKKLFSLNRYTGLLSFTHIVSQQDAGLYELEFIVKDNGIPVLNKTTNLSLVLTVSNKTFEMMSESHQQSSKKTHLFLMIAIVLVSMTVSVPITAVIAICIVRCRNRKNNAANTCKKHVSEQRHLMCPSHLETSWADVPGDRTLDLESGRSIHSAKSRRGIYPGEQLDKGRKSNSLGMKSQKDRDIIYQVSFYLLSFYFPWFMFFMYT